MWTWIFVTSFVGSLAQIGIAYPKYAETMGLPRGEMTTSKWWDWYHGSALLLVLLAAWGFGRFLGLLSVLLGALLIGALAAKALGYRAQIISLASLPFAVVLLFSVPY